MCSNAEDGDGVYLILVFYFRVEFHCSVFDCKTVMKRQRKSAAECCRPMKITSSLCSVGRRRYAHVYSVCSRHGALLISYACLCFRVNPCTERWNASCLSIFIKTFILTIFQLKITIILSHMADNRRHLTKDVSKEVTENVLE